MEPRRIRAQRGTALRCKGWHQEVILRMLENNLENGERPEDLVIYMSAAKAARDWDSFDRIVQALKTLDNDETLIVQSGKPVARFRTHERAPRVLLANGNVLGRWAGDDAMFQLEQRGLTILPGMTAACWQYIGSQGIVQGTYQSFVGAAHQYFGGSLAGRVILTAGCGGMGGAQPLAGKMAGAATLVVDANPDALQRRADTGYLDTIAASLDDALARIQALAGAGEGGSVGLPGNAADLYEAMLARGFQPDIVTDQCMVDPYRGYVPSGSTPAQAARWIQEDPAAALAAAAATLLRHAGAILEFQRRGALAFEYGNTLRARAVEAGLPQAAELESFVTLFIRPLFCQGIGPFRWVAASGDPKDIEAVDAIIDETFDADHPIRHWIGMARRHIQFQGLPARIGWLGHGERSRLALRVNEAVASGRISAPIAFTRDHLDAGSVASPYRETEKMRDGSDAIADWPLLNAMLACSGGATLVAIHSNGNKSQSAGHTVIADGTPLAAERLAAVLDGDTGIGVTRYAEAGYEQALGVAEAAGLGVAGAGRQA
ncbi:MULTISPECIES: urocanate hydratase [Achromobacter]|uniref:Urocanate hydratase n=1 Tax=Achromobacter denitrificans TaxID=32002 RepID=A0A6N0JE39_ACHDE|nr:MULTISPECIES: urocanate hydratase [Achromobacter]QKQ45302.1 urocanate hydratase [Achromobacter denitrificans]